MPVVRGETQRWYKSFGQKVEDSSAITMCDEIKKFFSVLLKQVAWKRVTEFAGS